MADVPPPRELVATEAFLPVLRQFPHVPTESVELVHRNSLDSFLTFGEADILRDSSREEFFQHFDVDSVFLYPVAYIPICT